MVVMESWRSGPEIIRLLHHCRDTINFGGSTILILSVSIPNSKVRIYSLLGQGLVTITSLSKSTGAEAD
jgi:hypothetical protein